MAVLTPIALCWRENDVMPALIRYVLLIITVNLALVACGGGESDSATLVPTAENDPGAPGISSDESPRTDSTAPNGQIPPTWTPMPPPKTPTPLPTPQPDETYIVEPGDTLAEIAEEFGVDLDRLVSANDIQNIDVIHTGTVLIIPR
jgi:nucleoid-associated protein YgaU